MYEKFYVFDNSMKKKLIPFSAFIGAKHKRMDVYERVELNFLIPIPKTGCCGKR